MYMEIFNADCLDKMKEIVDDSIDLIFCDLPYATKKYSAVSCKWNTPIDLEEFWKQVMRIKKINTPIFFTTTTKFGVELIQSAPKKCPFRYDVVWLKSSSTGFLSSSKMPLRKHEMIYVFYEKLPFYDLSSHKHKFIKEGKKIEKKDYNVDSDSKLYGEVKRNDFKERKNSESRYDPPLPVSVVKEELCKYDVNKNAYGGGKEGRIKISKDKKDHQQKYDPPLPTSVVKEQMMEMKLNDTLYGDVKINQPANEDGTRNKYRGQFYDPPLPTSIVKEEDKKYDPNEGSTMINGTLGGAYDARWQKGHQGNSYDPPLPTSALEIKSTKGKHSTEKPVALMEWILKYYSKEGDIVLDPTMGSGSTGVACKNMNRNFIGIEKDKDIFEGARKRLS